MTINQLLNVLTAIGLSGDIQSTGSTDYARVFVRDSKGVSLARATIYCGVYQHIKWYDGISGAYDINQSRPMLAFDVYMQRHVVLTDAIWFDTVKKANFLRNEEVRRLKEWRRNNPPALDHIGKPKRRRSIQGPSLMKCVRQVLELEGVY